MESQLRHTLDAIAQKKRSMAAIQQEIEVQVRIGCCCCCLCVCRCRCCFCPMLRWSLLLLLPPQPCHAPLT